VAQIELLQPTEKIKDSYGKINTSLTNLNNNKLEKSGDTMTGSLEIISTQPLVKLFDIESNNSTWLLYDNNSFYLQLRDSSGEWIRDLLRLSGDGLIQLVGNQTMWHGGNNPSNLDVRGYQKFASGLILQWGFDTITSGSTTFTLPIAYPTSHLATIPVAESSNPDLNVTAGSFTLTQFTAWANDTNPVPIRWISVGV